MINVCRINICTYMYIYELIFILGLYIYIHIYILGHSRHSLNIHSNNLLAVFLLVVWISLAFCELPYTSRIQFRY